MPKLSDTQAILLSAAAQRADGNLLPLPASLRGSAASKVVDALLSRGFVEETVVDDARPADPALNTLWRNLEDGRGLLLRITQAGREALGIKPDSTAVAATGGGEGAPAGHSRRGRFRATVATRRRIRARPAKAPSRPCSSACSAATRGRRSPRSLPRPAGSRIMGAVVAATGAAEKVEGRGRVYRIVR